MTTPWSPAQIVGYFAFAFGVLAFLQKNDKRLKLIGMLECSVYALHFFLLENHSAAVLLLLSVARNTAAIYVRSPRVAFVFILAAIGAGLYTAQHWYNGVTIIGQCLSTVALFTMTGVHMRIGCGASSYCWLINAFMSGSIGGMALEALILIANAITIVRLLKDGKSAAENGLPPNSERGELPVEAGLNAIPAGGR